MNLCAWLLVSYFARTPQIIGTWESEFERRGKDCVEVIWRRGKWKFQDQIMWIKAAPQERCL